MLICVFLTLISCGSKNHVTTLDQKITVNSYCPDDGVCHLDVMSNKELMHKYDGSGMVYPEVIDGEQLVLKFEYKRHEIPNTADGHYSEELYIALNKDVLDFDFTNADLQKTNMLFARFCYCKGQTGYYKIVDGHLKVRKISNDTFQLDVTFKTDLVPQIITQISETFTL